MAILGDSVDTMGSQYITSPNPTPDPLQPPLYPLVCSSSRATSTRIRPVCTSTNEFPRCCNSLGASVIAATAFLERVIVQQRTNGIAGESSSGRGREREREREKIDETNCQVEMIRAELWQRRGKLYGDDDGTREKR